MRKLLVLPLLVIATNSYASNWIPLTEASNLDRYLIDTSSISQTGKMHKAWFKMFPNNPMLVPISDSTEATPQNYVEKLILVYFDCNEHRSSVRQMIYHGANGNTVGSYYAKPDTEYNDVPPDSIAEDMLAASCKQSAASHNTG